jgi:hypothetical protein
MENRMDRILFAVCLLAALAICGATNAATKHHKRPRAAATESLAVTSGPRDRCADPYAVCWAGTYIGRDPDPHVRAMLLWDFQAGLAND